jgi:hypothetical protein
MYRRPLIGLVLVALLLFGVGATAYAAGSRWSDDHDRVVQVVDAQGQATGQAPVYVIENDRHWGGFFPFPFLLFPLVFFALFWIVLGGFRGGRGRGRWGDETGSFEEWHRRQHGGEQGHEASS